MKPERVDDEKPLVDMGLDSIAGVTWIRRINDHYGLSIAATEVYNYPTLYALATHVLQKGKQQGGFPPQRKEPAESMPLEEKCLVHPPVRPLRKSRREYMSDTEVSEGAEEQIEKAAQTQAIAIIGMSGRFPMAKDLNEFWDNVREGKDCIREIPEDRWDWKALYGDVEKEEHKTKIKWGGFIEGVGELDPLFCDISPREAAWMDPQQRLLMTYTWRALEDAGIAPHACSQGATGVFIAAAPGEYMNLVAIPFHGIIR